MSEDTAWMGTLPEAWEVKDLRHIAEVILGLTYSPNDVVAEEDKPLVIRASNVQNGKLVHADDVHVDMEIPKKKMNQVGDVVVCSRNGSRHLIGKSAVVTEDWLGATFGAFMTTVRSPYPEWISWILASDLFKYQSGRFMSSTINQLTTDTLKSFAIPLPPLETQKRIAGFLDEKTAQIDGLIAKKRALLDRLAEKRQALITRAVTKGLNPNAPMKDSGIDWLGDIPAHWETAPLKWKCLIKSGQVDPTEPKYSRLPLIAPDHIEGRTGRLLEVVSAEDQGAISGKYLCSSEDVLYSKIRPALRKVTLFDGDCLCSADMYAISGGNNFDRRFLFCFFLTDAFSSYAELESLRVAMPKVNREALGNVILPLPPLSEQIEIGKACATQDAAVEAAIDSVKDSVAQLEEYRAALISSAVTGKIEGLR